MTQQFIECDGKVSEKVSKKTGDTFRIQTLALFTEGQSWPHVFERFVPSKEEPLARGRYRLKPRFYVNEQRLKMFLEFEAIVAVSKAELPKTG